VKAHVPGQVEVPPTTETICAVYVTYHPDAKFPERVARVMRQVAHIVIVDNLSNKEAVRMLRALCEAGHSELIENKENLGVATALNQGARRAIERGYAWVLMLDQDSWPDTDAVGTLSEIYATHPDREKVKIIGSNYRRPVTGHSVVGGEDTTSGFIETAAVITSCSMMSLKAFEEVGPFRDDFFIDQVDDEYCLRLRSYGHKVLLSCKPLMVHSLGNATSHKILWKRPICTHHSPLRRYYITRNRLVLYRMYACKELFWARRSIRAILIETILIILYEDQKLQKLMAMLLGIWHALSGRLGRL
jgi:rhamnosyltransferase